MEGSLTASPKVQLCETIKDYEETLNESTGREDVKLHAFIISQTPREKLKKQSELSTPEEFAGEGIYFSTSDEHIEAMLHRVVTEETGKMIE